MKKTLDTGAVMNELKGASVFFPAKEIEAKPKPKPVSSQPLPKPSHPPKPQSTKNASEPASMIASKHDSLLEDIRKVVKAQGKEVAYVRLTQEEKNQLADIIYTYKRQGTKTSETEISRIAINYLLADYRANGKTSILSRLIEMLNA